MVTGVGGGSHRPGAISHVHLRNRDAGGVGRGGRGGRVGLRPRRKPGRGSRVVPGRPPATLAEPAPHRRDRRRPRRTGTAGLPTPELPDHRTGTFPAGPPRLGLRTEHRPGVRPRPPAGWGLPQRGLEQVQRPRPGGGETPRRAPDMHQRHHQIPPRPAAEERGITVRGAQPHRHPTGEMQLHPPPPAFADADGTRRRRPQVRSLVEAARHHRTIPHPVGASRPRTDPNVAQARLVPGHKWTLLHRANAHRTARSAA
jgi:hypothetical protein